MNIHFLLRQRGKGLPTIILMVYDGRIEKRKFMYSTGIKISPSNWDKRKSRPKLTGTDAIEQAGVNKYLNNLERTLIEYKSFRLESKKLSREDIKAYILKSQKDDLETKGVFISEEGDFHSQWERIIETTKSPGGKNLSPGTKRSKRQTLELIKKYCAARKIKLSFQDIDMDFYYDFDQFMQGKDLKENTRGKHFKEIKAVLREAVDRDIPVNLAYQKKSFKVIRASTDSVYLNEDELKKIYTTELPPTLEKQRDAFLMACYVGARHSDWQDIRAENMIKEKTKTLLKITERKTSSIVHIPMHPVVELILKKYKGVPPKIISNQKFNKALKEIAKKAGLGKVLINGKLDDKYNHISTHTARRSFATNAYLSRSMDVYQIMKCTGHKSESSFLKYLKLNGKDYAMEASESKFFKDKSWQKISVK